MTSDVAVVTGTYGPPSMSPDFVRLLDPAGAISAHGHNEMHRYGFSTGKQPGRPFHRFTLGEGMRAAIAEMETGYREMIEGWERQ